MTYTKSLSEYTEGLKKLETQLENGLISYLEWKELTLKFVKEFKPSFSTFNVYN